MASPPSILVLGAGELGRAMLDALTSHPSKSTTQISVLLRPGTINTTDATKQREISSLQALGVGLVAGDVVRDSEATLAGTLGAHHTVINATGMDLPAGTQTRLCRSALASGCSRYFPWQFGVDYDVIGPNSSQDLFTEQLAIRGMLRAQGKMEWVIVSTGMFTSFLFDSGFGLVDEGKERVMGIGSWQNAVTVTSPGDIGRVTAEIALAAPEVQGVVYTAGDRVTMARLAEIVEGLFGKKVERVLKTVDELKDELAKDPENGVRKYRVVFAEGVGISWTKDGTFNAQRGIEVEDAETWARRNIAKA